MMKTPGTAREPKCLALVLIVLAGCSEPVESTQARAESRAAPSASADPVAATLDPDLSGPTSAPSVTIDPRAGEPGALGDGKGSPGSQTVSIPAQKFIPSEDPVDGQYIVVFRDSEVSPEDGRGVRELTRELARTHDGKVLYRYKAALRGFAVRLPNRDAAMRLSLDPRVLWVEEDGWANTNPTQASPPSWGLDRVDQRNRPLNASYTYDNSGAGVNVYVIDSGIRRTHNDFGNRAFDGASFINDGRGAGDCNGHGTHVAGTIGGAAHGVAKGVQLFSVRVFGCTGGSPWSTIIAGVDWVTANHTKPAVANMSLSGAANASIDFAVANSVGVGVTYTVAAGNDNVDACSRSPARVGQAITTGATDQLDNRATYSNFGGCLDLFAPGDNIRSAYWTSNTAVADLSGTSMAAPHVAGVAALYLSANPGACPADVASSIVSQSTQNVVASAGAGSPNRLLYSRSIPSLSVCCTCTACDKFGCRCGTFSTVCDKNGCHQVCS